MARRSPIQRLEQRYSAKDTVQAEWVDRDDRLQDPFMVRVFRPFMNSLSGAGGAVTSKRERQDLQHMLAMAGYPGGATVKTLQAIRMMLIIALPVVMVLLMLVIRRVTKIGAATFTPLMMAFVAFIMAMVGYILLPFIVRSMVRKRQKLIGKTLPDVLDLLTIAVEAGMGFDAAMDRVGQRYRGAMGEELQRTCGEIRMGRPWNEAMRDLGDRTGVDDVRGLVTALIQAKELGVNLGNVLRAQSMRLREERARRARETAQKAPTKMMIPLILFIFPTLFIVLMGPAALRAAKELAQSDLFGKKGG